MNWWHSIVNYYKAIGEKFNVDPIIFIGIHIVATPLFVAAVWWIVYRKKKKKSLVLPIFSAIFVFNAANIYLILFGNHLPVWIYAFVGSTTIISGYFTVKKIRKKLHGEP